MCTTRRDGGVVMAGHTAHHTRRGRPSRPGCGPTPRRDGLEIHSRRVRRVGPLAAVMADSAGDPQQGRRVVAAIQQCPWLGVNWIDTAAATGFGPSGQAGRRGARASGPQRGAAAVVYQELAVDDGQVTSGTASSATSILRRRKPPGRGRRSTAITVTESTGPTRRGHRGGMRRTCRA